MQRTRVATRTILVLPLAPFVFGACGLLFTHAPPVGYEKLTHFTCTESTTMPVLDAVFSALNLIGAVAIAGNPDQYDNPGQATASGIIWGAISAVSAGVGFNRVHKCVVAKAQMAERQVAAPAPAVPRGNVQTVLIVNPDTLKVGAQSQFVANAFDASNTVLTSRMFRWSSSNDAIASVSNSGLVIARAPGTVLIAANSDNIVGTARVVVVSEVVPEH